MQSQSVGRDVLLWVGRVRWILSVRVDVQLDDPKYGANQGNPRYEDSEKRCGAGQIYPGRRVYIPRQRQYGSFDIV